MKKLLLTSILLFFGFIAFSQGNYEKLMVEKIKKLESATQRDELISLKDDFVILGNKQSDWLPKYYAALAVLKEGKLQYNNGETKDVEGYARTAEKYLSIIDAPQKNNIEVIILHGFINSFKFQVKSDGISDSSIMNTISKADKIDPNNPRLALLKAEFYKITGNSEKFSEWNKIAYEKLKSYKSKSAIHPSWGIELL